MSADQISAVVSRRWRLMLATFVLCLASVAAITFALPKVYRATATLQVQSAAGQADAPIDPNVGEELARTYTLLASNPNVADAVRAQLPSRPSREELLRRMSFSPVERTRLLQISAEGQSRVDARATANTYARVFARRVNQQYAAQRARSQVALSEPAARPDRAIKPNPPLYLGLGALLSGLLALGVGLLRDRFDRRLRVDEEDDQLLGLPVLGHIPTMGRVPDTVVQDAYRLLKANLDLSADSPPTVIVVTSPRPLEGKSTTAAQLALTAAGEGARTVLLEGDLRRPGLAATAVADVVEPSSTGLSSYVTGRATVLESLSEARDGGLPLDVMWAGPPPANPTAVLRNRRLRDLIESLRHTHQRVIIDASPVSIGADATLLSSYADAVVYVVDADRTTREAARAGVNQLRQVGAPVAGVVVNRFRADAFTEYYQPHDSQPNGRAAALAGARSSTDEG